MIAGMCSEAVQAYLKFGDQKAAVNACVNLRQWGQAVELAQRYQMPEVNVLLGKHAAQLLNEGRLSEAIELQRKAGKHLDAARLLCKMAEQEVEKRAPLLRIKKIYILAALLAEDHLKSLATPQLDYAIDRNRLLDSISLEDAAFVERLWHCAEGYHYMLLAQRQLRFGIMHSAVVTSIRLRDYDDVLPMEDIYNLLALASCADRSFETCSKAFMKLESLETLPEKTRQEYEELAVSIFTKNEPKDLMMDTVACYGCAAQVRDKSVLFIALHILKSYLTLHFFFQCTIVHGVWRPLSWLCGVWEAHNAANKQYLDMLHLPSLCLAHGDNTVPKLSLVPQHHRLNKGKQGIESQLKQRKMKSTLFR